MVILNDLLSGLISLLKLFTATPLPSRLLVTFEHIKSRYDFVLSLYSLLMNYWQYYRETHKILLKYPDIIGKDCQT